jgi:hypothetical protein
MADYTDISAATAQLAIVRDKARVLIALADANVGRRVDDEVAADAITTLASDVTDAATALVALKP